MHELLAGWDSFYILVGSSAGALTGLQFVVMALVAETGAPGDEGSVQAFGTPQVVHFCAVLLIAAILSSPWPTLAGAGIAMALLGAAGIAYATIVMIRAARQRGYQPVFEDWLWHVIFPLAAYVTIIVSAVFLPARGAPALFGIGAASLLLLFIGIHNAWDTVTYIALQRAAKTRKEQGRS